MERATKAAAAAGLPARIIVDLEARRIEIIIGESAAPVDPAHEVFGDDDV